jgi:two-component system nitrate/nitrite response regulator NarL
MVKRYNLAVIDRNLVVRAGLKQIFCRSTLRVIFDDASLGEFQERVPNDTNIDAILIGAEPRSETLDDDVKALREAYPKSRVVLMAQSVDEAFVARAARSGLDGLVLGPTRAKTMIKSLELILLGERFFPVLGGQMPSSNGRGQSEQHFESERLKHNLSLREVEVLNSLCEGNANKVIARRLGITESTVKVHVKAILRKIQVKNRTEAALWAKGYVTEHRQSNSE